MLCCLEVVTVVDNAGGRVSRLPDVGSFDLSRERGVFGVLTAHNRLTDDERERVRELSQNSGLNDQQSTIDNGPKIQVPKINDQCTAHQLPKTQLKASVSQEWTRTNV